jgi:transposase-like protein
MDNTTANQVYDPEDGGVSEEDTAKILDVEPGTLATWRSQGKGPKFRKIGRRIEYTPRFIKEYQRSCVRSPESAATRRQQRAASAA